MRRRGWSGGVPRRLASTLRPRFRLSSGIAPADDCFRPAHRHRPGDCIGDIPIAGDEPSALTSGVLLVGLAEAILHRQPGGLGRSGPGPASGDWRALSPLAFGREHASDPATASAPVRRRALVRPERLRRSKAEATSAPTSACSPASRATPASARRRGLTDPSLVGSSRSSPRQTVPLSSGSKCGAREVRDERDHSGAAQSADTVASIWNRNSG